MTGNWDRPPLAITGSGTRRCGPTQVPGGGINPDIGCKTGQDNFWVDYEWISPSRFGPSRPIYKPEFWDKIQELDQWTNKYDPVMTCQPLGLPRQGTPDRIIQTPTDIIFFYRNNRLRGRKLRIPRHSDRRPSAPRHGRSLLLRAFYRKMGGRHAGDRFHQLRRYHLVRTRRPTSFRRHAHR
jgi:hypothetical protein